MNKKTIIVAVVLFCVFSIGALYRLYNITSYPPGLFPDQAANGEDALLVLNGDMRPFYPRGNGREALFFYLEAAAIRMFGIGVWPLFATSAVIGIATVVATYFATRPFFGRLAGILAALFLASSYWHVTISRTGFRAILIPLFIALFTAFVGYTIRAVRQKKPTQSYVLAALAGASFMGGFYTYIAYRVMVGVVLGVLFFILLAAWHKDIGFPHIRRYGTHIITAVIAGLLVFAPLGYFFVQHPETFVGRAGQVSVFNSELQEQYGGGTLVGTIAYSTRETLLSFFIGQGDQNWRHSVPGFPLLNPVVGTLFILGLVFAVEGLWRVAVHIVKGKELHVEMVYPYLLLLLTGMLLPVITTAEGIPHGLRAIGLAVPIMILAGAAGAFIIHGIQRERWPGFVKSTMIGVIAGVIIVATVYDGALYVGIPPNDANAYYEYRGDLTVVSRYINQYAAQQNDAPRPLLVLDPFSLQTVHFLTAVAAHDYVRHPDEARHKYMPVDPATSHQIRVGKGEHIIFTQSTLPDADRYEQTHGDTVALEAREYNRFGDEIMRVYKGISLTGESAQDSAPDQFNLDAG